MLMKKSIYLGHTLEAKQSADDKHEYKIEIKAVTYHELKIQRLKLSLYCNILGRLVNDFSILSCKIFLLGNFRSAELNQSDKS